MLELIKDSPFVPESKAVYLKGAANQPIVASRYDKVTYAKETLTAKATNDVDCYVDAAHFFTLLPEAKEITQEAQALHIVLNNGADYRLEFLRLGFEAKVFPVTFPNTIKFTLTNLMKCTSKNLVSPEMQHIWIDREGAISCDFNAACICPTLKAEVGFLLPVQLHDLVDGGEWTYLIEDNNIYLKSGDKYLTCPYSAPATPTPQEDGTPDKFWWEKLRAYAPEGEFKPVGTLRDQLKRLMNFDKKAKFTAENKITTNHGFEPTTLTGNGEEFELDRLIGLLDGATEIAIGQSTFIKNGHSWIIISAIEQANG